MGLADRTYMHPWDCPCSECEGNRQKDEGKKRNAELALEDNIWQEKEFADNFDKMMRPPAPAPAEEFISTPAPTLVSHPIPAPKRKKKQKPTPAPVPIPAPIPTPPDAPAPQPEAVGSVPWKQLLMGALVVGLSVILILAYIGVI